MKNPDHDHNVAQTYLALRWAMLVVVGMLLIAVIFTGSTTGHWQTSISAYYYTAARPAFVAGLCAIGACLILYHAGHPENVILDVAGFLAFVVAFVPTTIDFANPAPGMINVPSADEVAAVVKANMLALLIAGVAALVVGGMLWRKEQPKTQDGRRPAPTRSTLLGCSFALAAGVTIFLGAPTLIENHAHYIAAGALFVGLFFVVFVNMNQARARRTHPGSEKDGGPYAAYAAIAVAMPASLVVFLVFGLLLGFKHWIFWVETFLITEFAIFWQLQTYRRVG